jgi:5-methylthioadenosine/S-adenosylhomocysteine deaminase
MRSLGPVVECDNTAMTYQPVSEAAVPESCDFLIEARHVVPIEPHGGVLEHHAVAIRSGVILAVLPIAEARIRFEAKETVSRPDGVLIPGLINAHCHNPMTLMRGVADDLPLKQWLQEHIWPIEGAVMGPEFVADGIALAIAEMLRGGTTCCNENYFFPDVQAGTYKRYGFRARVGLPVIDFPTAWAKSDDEYFDRAGEVHDHWRDDALIATAFAPHAPYTVSAPLYEASVTVASARGLPMAVHLAESQAETDLLRSGAGPFAEQWTQRGIPLPTRPGSSPVVFLDRTGVLGPQTLCIHVVQVNDSDIARLALAGVAIAHCPRSNRAHRHGDAPLAKLLAAGLRIGVGTDSVASAGDLDLLAEARLAGQLANLSPERALGLVTLDAARALGLADEVGHFGRDCWGDACVVATGATDAPAAAVLARGCSAVVATYLAGRAVWREAGKTLEMTA